MAEDTGKRSQSHNQPQPLASQLHARIQHEKDALTGHSGHSTTPQESSPAARENDGGTRASGHRARQGGEFGREEIRRAVGGGPGIRSSFEDVEAGAGARAGGRRDTGNDDLDAFSRHLGPGEVAGDGEGGSARHAAAQELGAEGRAERALGKMVGCPGLQDEGREKVIEAERLKKSQ